MGYIVDLYLSRIKEIELTNSALFTLCQFTKSEELSTYQISNTLKSTKYAADYKNVHKKIKRFLNTGLIKKTKTLDRKHNSKFYRLSSVGIFSIFYHLHGKWTIFHSEILNIMNGILTNYGDDDFFNFFIYPFFAKNTIINIESNMITEFFINYCTECAHKSMSKLYDERLIDKNGKFASKERIQEWLSDIKDDLNTDCKDNDSLLKNEQLKRDLNDINDKVLFELGFDKVAILENTMIFPIIGQGKYKASDIRGIEHSPMYKRNWKVIEKDVILLLKDQNFYKMLKTTKKGFNNCYESIIKCRSS